ncbi:hypothetical protein SteCoe_33322 [Stentor coeruleus]|uniref:GPS domain-containing protein n=1 Tax=Stentor coeruleus TaxID=5963 RepID=A0A1R2AWY7_9CILI|nr:hypothetical protein SteCoe_33322 [Stentor coeruleus]
MFILPLLRIAAGTLFISHDSMLDPEVISWPNNWVSSMVTLSSNHQGATDTKATVEFNVPIELPIGTYAELDLGFPSPFSVVLDKAQAKEEDNKVTFTVGTLPSKGIYGPMSLMIRQSSTGQILAASNNIGILAILDSMPIATSNSLQITHTGQSKVASQPTSLKFSFTLASLLNPLDILYLEFDSSFSIPSTQSLSWDNDASGTKYLISTNYQFKYTLSDSNNILSSIYIYGCTVEVPPTSVITFTITGFENPDYAKNGNSYLWKLSVIRFGTQTILQAYSGTSPIDDITAGPISIVKWKAANEYIDVGTQLAQDSILFMVLTFSITHELSETQTISISFTGLTLNDYSYKADDATQTFTAGSPVDNPYIYTNSEKISCEITSSTEITCEVQETMTLSRNSVVNVYTLSHFSSSASSASVSNIVSSDSSFIYDKLATSYILTLQTSTAKLITNLKSYFAILSSDISNTAVNSAASSLLAGLCISFKTLASLTEPVITVRAPIIAKSDSTNEDATLTTIYQGFYTTNLITSNPVDYSTANSLTKPTNNMVSFTEDRKIVVTHPKSFSANEYVDFVVVAGNNNLVAGTMKMPYFSTRIKSMHEFTLSYTSDNVFYYYSKPFYFAPVIAIADFIPACTSAGIPGALSQILWTGYSDSVSYTIIPDYSVYADFTFTTDDSTLKGDYGSGLDSGSNYPSNDVGTGNTFTIKYSKDESNAHSTHLILTYSSSIPSGPTSIRFPFPSLVSGKVYTLKARVYAKAISDENLYILSESSSSSITATSGVSTTLISSETDSSLTQNMLETINSFTFTIDTVASTGGAGLVFSKGFFLSGTSTFDTNSLTIYSSDDPLYNFYTAFIGSKTMSVASSVSFALTSVTLPWYSGSVSFIFYATDSTEFAKAACTHSATINLNIGYVSSSNLVLENYSPKTATGFGHSSQVVDLEIIFLLPSKIRALPEISFQVSIGNHFNADGCKWEIKAGSYYSAKGTINGSNFNSLTDIDSSNTTETGQLINNIPKGTILIIKVYEVVVPEVTDTDTSIYPGFSSVYVMYKNNYISKFIDTTDGSDSTTRTTFTIGASASKSKINSVYVFPNIQDAENVFFQIEFTISVNLPKGTDITIQGEAFIDDSLAKDNTWCSEGFSSVITSNSKLIITTNHDILQNTKIFIRKDKAFNIGSTSTQSSPFMIQANYMNVNFIQDDNSYTDTNKITYTPSLSGNIKSVSLKVDITTIAMLSAHNFTFSLNIDTNENWYYVFEAPKDYNAHPGPYFEFEDYPNMHYYTAATDNNNLYCYGDHWVITCFGINSVNADTPISIYILLNNPIVLSTNWKFYIVDSNGNLVVNPYKQISATFTGLPESIFDIQYINRSQSTDIESNIQIRAKVTDSISSDSMIVFMFPQPYQLELYNSKTISCSHVYETSPPVEVFPEGSTCYASSNSAIFLLQKSIDLSSEYWNNFTFYNIEDPLTGLIRKDNYFDAFDTECFEVYDYWTRKFTALILTPYSESPQSITSISFANLNSAYTGFYTSKLESLIVNDGKNILLIPGTYSGPISISTSDNVLHANWLEIYPSNAADYENFLTFSGSADYYLTIDSPKTTFMIGIIPKSQNLIIYLSWEIYESAFIDGESYYRAPQKTLVNIFDGNKIQVQVSEISYAVPGFGTFPIELSISPYSPFNDLTIEFTLLSSDPKIEFIPKIVTFTSKDSIKSFQIAVNETATIGTVYDFSYKLSGECSEYFDIEPTGNFIIDNIYTEAPIIKTAIDVKSSVKVDLLVNLNSDSIVYWALISSYMFDKYPDMATLEYIKSYSAPIFGDSEGDQSSIEHQIAAWSFAISQVPGDTWEEYNNNFLKLGSQMYFSGIKYAKKGDSILQTFNNLIASTNLVLVAWADNMSGNDLANSKSLERTEDPLPPVLIDINFDNTLKESLIEVVPQSIAGALEVYSSMVIIWQGAYRRLETTVSCLLLSSVYFDFDPIKKASSITNQKLAKFLTANGITSAFSIASVQEADFTVFGIPEFYNSTFILNSNVLEFWFTAGIYGTTICIQEFNPNITTLLSSYNIFFGLDREGNSALSTIYSISYYGDYNVIEWNLNEITTDEIYIFSCTFCNNNPINPDCLTEAEIVSYNLTWISISYGTALSTAFIFWLSTL